jgi:hypothetical protein
VTQTLILYAQMKFVDWCFLHTLAPKAILKIGNCTIVTPVSFVGTAVLSVRLRHALSRERKVLVCQFNAIECNVGYCESNWTRIPFLESWIPMTCHDYVDAKVYPYDTRYEKVNGGRIGKRPPQCRTRNETIVDSFINCLR